MWPAALAFVPAAASAADSTVKGTVAGPGTPDAGEGVTAVRAVNAETGAIGGADYTAGKRDGWSLTVAPGPYAMGATTVPFGGGKLIEKLLAFVEARSGKTETVKLKLKRKRRHHHSAAARPAPRVAEGFGDVTVPYPAIWVKQFDVQSQNPELGVMRKGMAAMLTTDILAALGTPDCPGVVVERDRIDEVINEQRLQQLPGFDQGSAVPRGHLIRDNASVSGTISESGGHAVITATYTDRRPGHSRTKTVAVQGPAENIFDLEQQLAQKLIEVICSDGLPDTYSGSFDGRSADSEMTRTWSGTVTYERVKPPDPQAGYCASAGVACYNVAHGSVTWQVSTTPGAMCTYQSASQTDTISPGYGAITVEASGSDQPGYGGGLTANAYAPGTIQCGSSNPGSARLALQDCCWATPAQSDPGSPWTVFAENGGWILQGTRSGTGGGTAFTYSWNLTGQ
jgi:hypothetical protein